MAHVSIGAAFIAGILSFLSPCVLPLVPGYISFLSGLSLEELKQGKDRKKTAKLAGLVSVCFVLGFSVVFIALGASAAFIGKFLIKYAGILTKAAGVIIIILGLHLTGLFKIKQLNYQRQLKIKGLSPGPFSAFLIGLAFAFGWTPCVGPILAGILALAASQNTLLRGVLLLSAYSLGIGIPFIITGFAMVIFMRFFEKYKAFIKFGEIAAGILLIIIGALIFSNNLVWLIQFIPESMYKFAV